MQDERVAACPRREVFFGECGLLATQPAPTGERLARQDLNDVFVEEANGAALQASSNSELTRGSVLCDGSFATIFQPSESCPNASFMLRP
jgi:hypothetical protein